MRNLILNKKLVLTVTGLMLILLIIKGILLWTAKPKVTVDYVAEYNKVTQPQNYDPNKNAANDYQKAFDSFIEMPGVIRWAISPSSRELLYQLQKKRNTDFDQNGIKQRERFTPMTSEIHIHHIDWPTDYNEAEQNILRQWLASNEKAFEHFRNASLKQYYWFERNVDIKGDAGMSGMLYPEVGSLCNLVDAMIWNAKLQTAEGHVQSVFDDVLTCYRAGQHNCRTPSLLTEQFLGLRMKENALTAVICILDRVKIGPADFKKVQDALQEEFNKDIYLPDFEAEKIMRYDVLQRLFIDNGKGSGRLAWSAVKGVMTLCGVEENFKFRKAMFLCCLFGPTRNAMVKRIEETFAFFTSARTQTPWQLHSKDPNYFNNLGSVPCIDCGNFSLDLFFPVPSPSILHKYYQVKARGEALLTILAIQRFKAEKGLLPSSLDELVSDGYLHHHPLDPYSGGTLVYRPKGNDFILYSVGENFVDDGGKEPDRTTSNPTEDIIFWPVKKF